MVMWRKRVSTNSVRAANLIHLAKLDVLHDSDKHTRNRSCSYFACPWVKSYWQQLWDLTTREILLKTQPRLLIVKLRQADESKTSGLLRPRLPERRNQSPKIVYACDVCVFHLASQLVLANEDDAEFHLFLSNRLSVIYGTCNHHTEGLQCI